MLLNDALAGRVRPGADLRPWTVGTVVSINTSTSRMLVDVDGGEVELPFQGGGYLPGDTVTVIRDPFGTGAGQFVSGRFGAPPPPPPPATPPVPVAEQPPAPTTQRAEATLSPTWSGSWRHIRGAYDRWNENRAEYGGRSSLWQGDGYTSGPMNGIAVYGDQVLGLGAAAIELLELHVVPAAHEGTPLFQATRQGGAYPGVPAPEGPVFGGVGVLHVPDALYEPFRLGTYKGFVTVGGDPLAVRGTSAGNGMALHAVYQKPL